MTLMSTFSQMEIAIWASIQIFVEPVLLLMMARSIKFFGETQLKCEF